VEAGEEGFERRTELVFPGRISKKNEVVQRRDSTLEEEFDVT
jgi:hypothetical protein